MHTSHGWGVTECRACSILLWLQDTRRDASQLLTRQGLLSDVTNKGLLNLVPEPINQLYNILEQDFSPLHLCQKLAPLLDQLEGLDQTLSAACPVQNIGLLQYKKTLQQVTFQNSTKIELHSREGR